MPNWHRNNLKESPADFQPLTTIQQNNLTPQPPLSRDPITLTVCVTPRPSTTSRQHYFHRTAPLNMKGRIYFRSPRRSWQLTTPPYTGKIAVQVMRLTGLSGKSPRSGDPTIGYFISHETYN
jgi:hypothetical protein